MDPWATTPRQDAQSSSPMSSPIDSTRRFAQYKPRTSAGLTASSSRDASRTQASGFQTEETPQRTLWRERLRVQVEKRARKERQKAYDRGRSEELSSEAGSEGDIDMEDNMDDLDDELYRRIMIEERRRLDHQRRLAYEREFGDSDDVFMEDLDALEKELANPSSQSILAPPSQVVPRADPSTASFTQDAFGDDDDEDEANLEEIKPASNACDPSTLAKAVSKW
ncbi:13286_t:CDS:2 [Acaulospora colombiana]|uniref:13286_t:CDS:1 n=1 Tax=Acaulospora colombiana TaxID=27376 RepID=A0ACA9PLV7_9GLOM|nr:13286_t:CDS:2 [Acaulospora colombiana]